MGCVRRVGETQQALLDSDPGLGQAARGRGGPGLAGIQLCSGGSGVAELSVPARSWRTPRGVGAGAATQGKAVELNLNFRDSYSCEIRGAERRQ